MTTLLNGQARPKTVGKRFELTKLNGRRAKGHSLYQQDRPRRLLCQCLAEALGQTLIAKDLPTNPAEWQSLLRFANVQGVESLLRRALRENALMAELNRRYAGQLAHLIQTLDVIGVGPVLLKGAAALASGFYPLPIIVSWFMLDQ